MKQFREEFDNGEISALEYFSNRQNQKNVMKEIRVFGDEELKKSFLNLFDWVGEEDNYVVNTPGNQLYTMRSAGSFIAKHTSYEPEKEKWLRKMFLSDDKFTLNELLHLVRFAHGRIAHLIGENDASYREALIYQIKTFAPTINQPAITKVLAAVQAGSEMADELANTCIAYGSFTPRALQILQELGTPEQNKLYQMHHC